MLEKANHISYSRLYTLSACSKKYWFRYIDKEPKILDPISDYFIVGKIVDAALDSGQRGGAESFDDFIEAKKIEFADMKWESYCRGFWSKRREHCEEIYGAVLEDTHQQRSIKISLIDKQTGERIRDLEGNEIFFVGVIDAYNNKYNIIIENKTTSGGVDQVFLEHKFKGQTQLYSIYELQRTGDIPLVQYNYIKKPMIRQKKTETLDDYHVRMFEAGQSLNLERREVKYTQEELDETMQYFFDNVKAKLNLEPVQEKNSCFEFGKKCEYFTYCWKHQISSIKPEGE